MIQKKLYSVIVIPLILYLLSSGFKISQIILPTYVLDYSWSPNSSAFVYVLKSDSSNKLIWHDINSGKETDLYIGGVSNINWTNEHSIVYEQGSEIVDLDINDKSVKPLPEFVKSGFVLSPDKTKLAYLDLDALAKKQIWLWDFQSEKPIQLTHLKEGVNNFNFSPSGRYISFNYYGEPYPQNRLGFINVSDGQVNYLPEISGFNQYRDSLAYFKGDDSQFVFSRTDVENYNKRSYYLYTLSTKRTKEIFNEQYNQGLFNDPYFKWSPDFQSGIILSEKSNWNHVYLWNGNDKIKDITAGNYEVDSASFLNSSQLLISGNKDDIRQKHIYRLDLATNKIDRISILDGTDSDWLLSPDKSIFLYIHNSPYQTPDLWSLDLKNFKNTRITDSLPDVFNYQNIQAPQAISFKDKAKLTVNGWQWLPDNFNPNKKYKALVWLHGGPSGQVSYGWHSYWSYANFYSLFQYLLQNDYVITAVDYHGSNGYGRQYQEALFNKVGVIDVDDVLSAGEYLNQLPYIQKHQISLMGFSYGGYLTTKTLVEDKDKIFNAGITFSGPTAWDKVLNKYSHPVFRAIFGKWPSEDMSKYQSAEILNEVDDLQVPILVIHGKNDTTIPYSQAKLLIKELDKNKKPYQSFIYDGGHVPASKAIWVDAFIKIEDFLQSI